MALKTNVFQARGFYPITAIDIGGLRPYYAGAVKIYKGDVLHLSTSSGVVNTTYAFGPTLAGIAACDFDNGTAYTDGLPNHGDNTVSTNSTALSSANVALVIPPLQQYQFIVPCAASTVITSSYLGLKVDMDGSTPGKVLLTDTTGAGSSYMFYIDDFDASATAVAVNTYGYAIGHFVSVSA